MDPDSHWQRIAATDWLKHEWRFATRETVMSGISSYEVIADGCGLGTHKTMEAAREWMMTARPVCLAEIIARHPVLHPVEVVIEGGSGARLGRIRPELWGSYDGFRVNGTDRMITVLSAKARAAFPDQFAVFVRVYRRGAGGKAR